MCLYSRCQWLIHRWYPISAPVATCGACRWGQITAQFIWQINCLLSTQKTWHCHVFCVDSRQLCGCSPTLCMYSATVRHSVCNSGTSYDTEHDIIAYVTCHTSVHSVHGTGSCLTSCKQACCCQQACCEFATSSLPKMPGMLRVVLVPLVNLIHPDASMASGCSVTYYESHITCRLLIYHGCNESSING